MSQPAGNKPQEVHALFRDEKKHFVRINGWLPIAKKRLGIMDRSNDFGLRYFTLCGKDAIDILLFKREELIKDDERGFPSVYYCENHYTSFAEVQPLLGRTKGKRMEFEQLVQSADFENFVRDSPFDLVNLDFSGNCFPKQDAPFSATLKAIHRLLELQEGKDFDLFITFRARRSEENDSAIDELDDNMKKNFSKSTKVESRYKMRYPGLSPSALASNDYPLFLLATFPKILFGFGASNGFTVSSKAKFKYCRRPDSSRSYEIVKFIFSFEHISTGNSFGGKSRSISKLSAAYDHAILEDLDVDVTDVDEQLRLNQSLSLSLLKDVNQLLSTRKPLGM